MGKITIDVIGLAVIDTASGKAIFLSDPEPRIVGETPEGNIAETTGAVPAHFAFVAIPLFQHKSPVRERFRFYNQPGVDRPFGIKALHAWYLLSHDDGSAQFVDVTGVTGAGSAGTVEKLLSVSGKLVPTATLKSDVVTGENERVAALFDISSADITAVEDPVAKIGVKDEELPAIPVVRLVYATNSEPLLQLRRGDDTKTITLDDDAHLIAGVVPLEEIVGLQVATAPNDLMKHFDLIYELFDIPDDAERPLPKHIMPNGLAPPAQCGPPLRP